MITHGSSTGNSPSVTTHDLTNEKSDLEKLLQRPPNKNSYPPEELTEALRKFNGQYQEALPILLAAAERSDYETRMWALSGISFAIQAAKGTPGQERLGDELFTAARPTLSKILRSNAESETLRGFAMNLYLPFPSRRVSDDHPAPVVSAESAEDLLAAFRNIGKSDEGFGFGMGDHLELFLQANPLQQELFAPTLRLILNEGSRDAQFVAAYALAGLPGPKPPEVKAALVRELSWDSTASYRAAKALGKLASEAADAVPTLLAHARDIDARTVGDQPRSSSFYDAIFKIKPELRDDLPEGVARVKASSERRENDFGTPFLIWDIVKGLRNDQDRADMVASMVKFVQSDTNGYKSRKLVGLLRGLAEQPDVSDKRGEIDAIAKQLQGHLRPESELRHVQFNNLTLDARVVLTDRGQHPNERKIESVIEQFQTRDRESVNLESFNNFSTSLQAIDPEFEKTWRSTVMKNYPWLDRMLSTNTPASN